VQWSSSNERVATVSPGGLVTAEGGGRATMTAMSEGRSGSSAVTVQEPAGPDLGVGFGPEQFALIPAGDFRRGSSDGNRDERPVHLVRVSGAFYMQKTEVTQGQWRQVMGTNPSHFSSCGDRCPVEQVSWDDVQEFIRRLNEMTGETHRLPTEAEWEYAARAGTTGAYGGEGEALAVLERMGWYAGNAGNTTQPVARKFPNAWGLFDMHGNVWEWVQDWYGEYSSGWGRDPSGPRDGVSRVIRGGSWQNVASAARSATRGYAVPTNLYISVGFRLVRTP